MNYSSESIDQLITALAKAQGEMSAASKDTKGYNYKYADLAAVWDACRVPLSNNGLAVTQVETQNEHGDVLITILGHSSGQWIRSVMAIRVKPSGKMNELQDRGSVYTYLRRYSLSAIVGIAPAEDDDGKGGNAYQSPPPPPIQNQSPATTKMINEFQIGTLKKELETCSKEFKEKLQAFMSENKFNNYSELPEATFHTIIRGIMEDSIKMKKEVAQ